MKKAVLTAVLATIVTLAVNAQKEKAKDRFANLNLTAQQKTAVDSVRKVYDGQRAELKKDATVSEEARKEKLKTIRKEQSKAINTLLTDEQRKQLKAEVKNNGKKEE